MRTSPVPVESDESVEIFAGGQIEYVANSSADYPLSTVLPLQCWQYQYLKRAIDLSVSMVLVVVFAVPGLLIAAAVLLSSDGPLFYREQRIGRGGKSFRIWKFRSMYKDAARRVHVKAQQPGGILLEWRMCKHHSDPRITPVGGILRRWSLDEIPQLLNVLRGEMSLVGPRPIVQAEVVLYGDLLPYYLAATPGLSGAWQVSGRSQIGYDDRARLDAIYVSLWNIRSDIGILFRTIPAVLGRIGAC